MTLSTTTPRTHAAKALADKSLLYGITYSPPGKRKIYYYVLVDPVRERAFLREIEKEQGSINLTAYGTIVAAGYDEPSPEVERILQERYHTKLVPFEAA